MVEPDGPAGGGVVGDETETSGMRVVAMAGPARETAIRQELMYLGRALDRRGWVMATSGTFSARLDTGEIVITLGAKHKGRLELVDFAVAGIAPDSPPGESTARRWLLGGRPPVEVAIHQVIYHRIAAANVILQVQTPATVAASLLVPKDEVAHSLPLPDAEMVKRVDLRDPASLLVLPSFRVASRTAEVLDGAIGALRPPAFLIRGSGGTVFGRSIEEAQARLEALDFLCEIALRTAP